MVDCELSNVVECENESEPIIEPGMPIPGEWNRGDPRYSAMVQQVVGKISTRPGGTQEMGNVSGLSATFLFHLCDCLTAQWRRRNSIFKQCCLGTIQNFSPTR